MDNNINVFDISIKGTKQAATTLFHAFTNDPLMRWMFIDEDRYQQKGVPVMETWVKYCVLYGKAFRTEQFESIALRKKPGDIKFSFWRMFRSGMLRTHGLLGKDAFNRLMILDELATKEKHKNMGDQLFWYCWTLGTEPQHQQKGYGSALMNRTFELAKQDKLPCYLETASETSKQIHLNKGYKILSEFILPDSDIKIYTMLKNIT